MSSRPNNGWSGLKALREVAQASETPSCPPTPSATENPRPGPSAGPQCQTTTVALLDDQELAVITDALSLCREMLTSRSWSSQHQGPVLESIQQGTLFRLELRLLFLWESLSPLTFPRSESLRRTWLQRQVQNLPIGLGSALSR